MQMLPSHIVVETILDAISNLQTTIGNHFDWFCFNNFKVNLPKCHLFLSPFTLNYMNIKNSSVEGNSSENFFGVTVHSNFTFEKH